MAFFSTKNLAASLFHQPYRHSLIIYDDDERRRRKIRRGRSDEELNFLKTSSNSVDAAASVSSSITSSSVLRYYRISHLFFLYVIFDLLFIFIREICFFTSFSYFSLFLPSSLPPRPPPYLLLILSPQPQSGYGFLNVFVSAQTSPPPPPDSSSFPILGGVCNMPYLNPCEIESSCVPTVPIVGEAICRCKVGFHGDGRKISLGGDGCINIDECKANLHSCDGRNQRCVDTFGSFRCECKDGFSKAPDGKTCIDIDECGSEVLHTCNLKEMKCINVEGSFRCECLDETQIQDPVNGECRDMNECTDRNGIMNSCAHECVDVVGGYKCLCRNGWKLAADGFSCVDVDECAEEIDSCDREKKISTCKNTEGSYECVCNRQNGYQRNKSHLLHEAHCVNLNECEDNPYVCGGPNTCCLDLPPPQRYACNLPLKNGRSTAVTSAAGGGMQKSEEDILLSHSAVLGGGVAATNNVAATTAAAAAASAAVPSSVVAMTSRGCLDNNMKSVRWSLLPMDVKLLVMECQRRCQVNLSCDYFTFDSIMMKCSTKSSFYDRMSFRSFSFVRGLISGPKFCLRYQTPAMSPYIFPKPNLMPRVVRLGGGLIGRYLRERTMKKISKEEREETNYLVEEGRHFEAMENEDSSNGSSSSSDGKEEMMMKMKPKLKLFSDDDMEEEEEENNVISEFPEVLTEKDIQRLESNRESMIFVANEMSDAEMQKKMKEELDKMMNFRSEIQNIDDEKKTTESTHLFSDVVESSSPRLLQLSDILSVGSLGFGGTRRMGGGIGGMKCEAPFKLGSDLYKQRLFQRALKSVQSALKSSALTSDGSSTRLTPQLFADGIIKNTNDIAGGLVNWYKEIVRVPGEVMEATLNASSSLISPEFINGLEKKFDPSSAYAVDFNQIYSPIVGYSPPSNIGTSDRFVSAYTNRNLYTPPPPPPPPSLPPPQPLYLSSSPMSSSRDYSHLVEHHQRK